MSGGAYEYMYFSFLEMYGNEMRDAELNELIEDLSALLKELEWWQSGDTSEEDYYKALKEFKAKWFETSRNERLERMINEKIEETKSELLRLIGE